MHWISPRESAGLRIFAASSEPSAEPAPTRVCSSSIKMIAFRFSINSFMMVFKRSSNWPRYFVPATISERSSARIRFSAKNEGISPSAIRWASPSTSGRLADAGFADQYGVVLRSPAQDLNDAFDLVFPPDERVEIAVNRRLSEVTTKPRPAGNFPSAGSRAASRTESERVLRESSPDGDRVHEGFPLRRIFLLAVDPAASARLPMCL